MYIFTAREGPPAPNLRGREAQVQSEATGAVAQFLLHGREMSWCVLLALLMLMNLHSFAFLLALSCSALRLQYSLC